MKRGCGSFAFSVWTGSQQWAAHAVFTLPRSFWEDAHGSPGTGLQLRGEILRLATVQFAFVGAASGRLCSSIL